MEQIVEREVPPAQPQGQYCEVVQVNPGLVRHETMTPIWRRQVAPFAGYLTLRRERVILK